MKWRWLLHVAISRRRPWCYERYCHHIRTIDRSQVASGPSRNASKVDQRHSIRSKDLTSPIRKRFSLDSVYRAEYRSFWYVLRDPSTMRLTFDWRVVHASQQMRNQVDASRWESFDYEMRVRRVDGIRKRTRDNAPHTSRREEWEDYSSQVEKVVKVHCKFAYNDRLCPI